MSASDKKKLRKEQTAASLTERQRQEQAEAKKLKIYTISFVSVIALIACIAITVLVVRLVNNSGIIQKNTVAATVGEHKLNSVELSYYYNDAVSAFYNEQSSQYSDYTDQYLQVLGLDPAKPLDEQVYDEESGQTWADYFVDTAIANAKNDYALYDLAMQEGFTLPGEDQTTLDNLLNNLETYASLSGYGNSNQYLRAMYGYGADADSYGKYSERSAVADAYKQAHKEGLTYDDTAIREHEADSASKYNSYTYSSAYLSYTDFRQGGTEDEDGNKTYSEEENNAGRDAMKLAAEDMATATSVEELKEKAAAAAINDESQLAVNESENVLHTEINAPLADWLSAEERKEGDIAAIPNTSTTTDADGNETTVTNGYYVAIFHSKNDNTKKMANVRHLLVEFQGGETDETTGETTYNDTEKAEAKEAAEGYLKTWQEGDATEESFIALVKEHSDDSSAEDGGLFEDIHPDSNYVENFLNWSISADRKPGDADVIETEYGYHVMYYVGEAELSYRDYMITNEMRTADHDAWYNGIIDAVATTKGDTSKMELGLILSVG